MSRRHPRYARPATQGIEVPLKGYFLWVGGTLLTLLLAAHWLIPPPPLNPLISSRVRLPPIRIYTQGKAPDGQADDDLTSAAVAPLSESKPPAEAPPLASVAPVDAFESEPAPALSQGQPSPRRRATPAARALNSRDAFAELVPGTPKPASSTQTRHHQIPRKG